MILPFVSFQPWGVLLVSQIQTTYYWLTERKLVSVCHPCFRHAEKLSSLIVQLNASSSLINATYILHSQ